ncbi:lytic murein transglycosylase [Arenimonas sp. MALMAid1274]|uniref:lytic murein transglycosylase n=1 Tax=Arenimonas sp. MALMAid1274 TaxID=3411630 RepID=UPI003BA1E002
MKLAPLVLLALALPLPAAATPLASCLASLRPQAVAAGVGGATFDTHTAGLVLDPGVLESLDYQPEFRTPIWDYLAGLVDEQRVADGQARLAEHRATLDEVARKYGVDPATVVAVWGVESDYGRTFGKKPLLGSLATLSCEGRRQAFFRSELFATLKLIQSGDLQAEGLVGSWAGAFGHTQFMPSTYARIAVDHDGDGRRDLVGSIPDALASTANYLKRSGWRTGQPWGHEVILPEGFDTGVSGRQARRPLSQWLARGIVRADGQPLPASDTAAALLLPAGPKGPAFLVFKNFDAIYSYNAAESYALAIAHLSDRLRGGGPFAAAWPTDDPGLSRAQRKQLQELLLARGHAIGEADGMIGARSREALKLEQARLGLPADGRAGQRSLRALQQDAAPRP